MADDLVLLAKNYEPGKHQINGWYMSEKLDGVRAVFANGKFYSRQGNVFNAPPWFTEPLKRAGHTFDGELWIGRGEFQRTVSIVRSQEDKGWKHIRYQLFDVPDVDQTFRHRYETMQAITAKILDKHIVLVEHKPVRDHAHVVKFVDMIIAMGGEGAMLRDPNSYYERKRSPSLLKVKRFHDVEAKVIGHVAGKGKHKGRMGALQCKLKNGVTFEVGTGFTDAEREKPPRIGSMITVKYQELSRDNVPRFPSFLRVRTDAE